VNPILKDWDCSDRPDVAQWAPNCPGWSFWLTLHIGPAGAPGSDLFQVCVADASGAQLVRQQRTEALEAGGPSRAHGAGSGDSAIIVVTAPYSWESVIAEIRNVISRCHGDSWPAVVTKLRSHFLWEYESAQSASS
jgi:hypothetical protein